MLKHFLVNPNINYLDKDSVLSIETTKRQRAGNIWNEREIKAKKAFREKCTLKYVPNRVIVKVDLQLKNHHTFSDGQVIRLERQFNNFNRRETEPVNAIVISSEHIPTNSEILISHNALHDSNKIFSYPSSSSDIQYFSIPEAECFAWRDKGGKLRPMKNFEFGLRVFRPYTGIISNIEPTILKDTLLVTTGKFKGNVVNTLKASDYEIVFQNKKGQEERLIRIRHSDDSDFDREEITCINHELTDQVNNNELLIGYDKNNSKYISEWTK